jgi:DeoR/GlpR family transcriptional regulator of sugar metabolism
VDGSKLDRKAPLSVCRMEALDLLVTDRPLPGGLRALAETSGTRVIETAPVPGPLAQAG